MKKTLQILTILFIVCLSISDQLKAQNSPAVALGADLTYINVAPNIYVVQYEIAWDCNSAATLGNTVPLQYQANGCNSGGTLPLNLHMTIPGYTPPCSRNCILGTPPGQNNYKFVTYQGVLTIPATCTNWKLSVTSPGRIATNLDSTASTQMYSEATINNQATQTNTSATFGNDPVIYACVNTSSGFNQNVTDLDGDSLAYTLVAPLQQATTPAPYQIGYSVASPLGAASSFSINPVTGLVNFTPAVAVNSRFAIRIKITEFRKINGVITAISEANRDLMIIVENCAAVCRPVLSSAVQPLTKPFYFRANVETCYTFTANVCDPAFLNRTYGDPTGAGPYYTFSGSGINRTVTFCWRPRMTDIRPQAYHFQVIIGPTGCPIPGFTTQTILLHAIKDKVIDPGQVIVISPQSPAQRLSAPNIITPNNDGKNDAFVIQGLSGNAELQIYDRNKKLLKTYNNYKNNWQGEGLRNGIYFFILEDKETGQVLKGSIEIVR